MAALSASPRARSTGRVQSEPLAVSPALIGARLAGPGRRAAALTVDLAVLALLSQASSWALVVALLLLAALVHQALRIDGARPWLAHSVAVVLVVGALATAWATVRPAAPNAWDQAVDRAVQAAEATLEARDATAKASVDVDTKVRGEGVAGRPSVPTATTGPAVAPVSLEDELRRRLAELEALQRAHRPPTLSERLDAAVTELGLGLGWGIVYFSLLPAFGSGRTLGKRLMRLRIVELSGQPLTPLRALKRYGGYAAGIATGGLGFVQALWDPNRQCLHDKAAHTVVLDERDGAPPGGATAG